jgi:hypothetical protein
VALPPFSDGAKCTCVHYPLVSMSPQVHAYTLTCVYTDMYTHVIYTQVHTPAQLHNAHSRMHSEACMCTHVLTHVCTLADT